MMAYATYHTRNRSFSRMMLPSSIRVLAWVVALLTCDGLRMAPAEHTSTFGARAPGQHPAAFPLDPVFLGVAPPPGVDPGMRRRLDPTMAPWLLGGNPTSAASTRALLGRIGAALAARGAVDLKEYFEVMLDLQQLALRSCTKYETQCSGANTNQRRWFPGVRVLPSDARPSATWDDGGRGVRARTRGASFRSRPSRRACAPRRSAPARQL